MMLVNLKGPFFCCRAVLPAMRRQGSGSTTVLYPGQKARVDDHLNIEVELEESR
jgi:NAD(P)-dependent dehydrogenase (short-subunit alcohol dehydrogenase family)